ncbi:MAG: hypothetical protein FWE98_07595 [Oscillospiraceae bacterium]|nr:hypothetical protein [Oscillospiraceae bacterium]
MKKPTNRLLAILLAAVLLCGAMSMPAGAQGVDITAAFTDPAFRAAVQALIGKDVILDTDVAEVRELDVSGDWEDYGSLTSLAGLEYFTALEWLDCNYNQISELAVLPSSLNYLSCYGNKLTALPELPSGLAYLNCGLNQLSVLPALPFSLTFLDCGMNQLTELPVLPLDMQSLCCDSNPLTALPALPSGIQGLICNFNQLVELPDLPSDLGFLWCWGNMLTALPTLPAGLWRLDCDQNLLTELPELPASLAWLDCHYNQLTELPALPSGLTNLRCEYNQLTTLDVTGLQLERLWCHFNNMASESDVIGFTGEWDDENFIFDPQNADKTTLTTKLTQAKAIEKGNNTDATWNALQAAITAAQAVADNGNVTQAQVDAQVTALQNAIDGLIATDKAALTAKLTQAKAIEKGNHTDTTWNALQTAITAAQAVANDGNATQAQVDAQVTALQNAIDGLRENEPPPEPGPGLLQWALRVVLTGLGWVLWPDWPPILQFILKIVFFGWLWMRWL